MMKRVSTLLVCVALIYPIAIRAGDRFLRFDGGIGVIPVSNGTGTVNPDGTFPNVTKNIVRGVNPVGQIWVIRALKAQINTEGEIKIRGRGLLLGGGNNIGFNANASVFATLFCETSAPFSPHSTSLTGVPLEPNGDFRIDDVLDPVPASCPSPVLLIRSTGGAQPWFAAGILDLDRDDN